ncbi:hypothetical protein QZH41_015339 [Actinostola sp. cb2023]|nr:hypothetical protein QZH41_015339 [Actinostola sp. cb2023]
MLKVIVKGATNLPDVDRLGGKSDPYAVVSFRGLDEKTEVIKDELNPTWNQVTQFDLNGRALSADDELEVTIKDWERVFHHRLLGSVKIPLKGLMKGKGSKQDKDLPLLDGSQRPTKGSVQLSLEYAAPPDVAAKADEGTQDQEDEEEDEEDVLEDDKPGTKGPRKKRKKRRKLSDKVQDFQIRIKIHEARQLPGSSIHPLVQISVSDQEQSSRVKKYTNRPVYNQSFTFNFRASPADLFDDLITFEVFDSRKFRVDSLLSFFEVRTISTNVPACPLIGPLPLTSDDITIGEVFDKKGHHILRKWMLLSHHEGKDDDDNEEENTVISHMHPQEKPSEKKPGKSKGKKKSRRGGSPAGYLKATVVILGPGDEPPCLLLSSVRITQRSFFLFTRNLLRPSGVDLQPIIFSIKIYMAEDIPQMDSAAMQGVKKFFGFAKSGDKLVDPYVKFNFAGKKVETAIKYKTDHPDFNQILRVRSRFPSMCDSFKLQLFDWDRLTEDDCISTTYIFISDISGRGEQGFFPTFGPCFINFYGSPREFSELPDEFEDLNFGKGEGVAYRGRLMVEIETTLGDEIEKQVDTISPQDVVIAQPLLRRYKYKLFACFYEASMVSESDGPVEFEVSIGNYGNMMDESVAPSNTPPCNAVYDGTYYYYLPWTNNKPSVCVESYWEDIAFRLEPLNALNNIIERLESKIQVVQTMSAEGEQPKDVAKVLFELLDQLIEDCSNPLPKPKGRLNKLDIKLDRQRKDEMSYITKEASMLIEKATDISEALIEIQGYLESLRDLLIEPQNSIPDVIIWMVSGSNRIAYHRVPAHQVLYSPNKDASGKYCKKTIEVLMKYPGKKALDFKDHPEIPAIVRLEMWFGREEHQKDWSGRTKSDGEFCIYAETYENEMSVASFWTQKMLPRPSFSNASGELPLPKDKFLPPAGWQFDGDWFKDPELSLAYESDAGHTSFLQDIFENESRMMPGGAWAKASIQWSNVHNDQTDGPDEIKCPDGWEWTADWQIDSNRAVDDQGWEYSVDVSYGAYGPIQKAYHLVRRRRWARNRELRDPNAAVKMAEIEEFVKEGWEYANLFTTRFHAKERKMDFVRRRRWHRKMVADSNEEGSLELPPIFQMQIEGEDDAKGCIRNMPRMFVTFEKPHIFQLWVYLYQARDLISKDESGMNDCYVRASFGKHSHCTEVLTQTICPSWDQTLIFDHVEIHESLENITQHPPRVFLEFFDKDALGKDDFLGRCSLTPVTRLHGHQIPEPCLEWNDIYLAAKRAGEILAVCELFLDEGAELPFTPTKRENVFEVRSGVRPETQRAVIEVLSWGVRNMKRFELTKVTSPCIEFECGGAVTSSCVITNTKKNPNFDQPVLPRLILNLPIKEIYRPPINIRVRDNRSFGRKPIVGVHSVRSLAPFKCTLPGELAKPTTSPKKPPRLPSVSSHASSHIVAMTTEQPKQDLEALRKLKEADAKLDWWSKFYASIGDREKAGFYLEQGYKPMTIYQTELERVDKFKGFNDFILTFPIRRGKVDEEEDEDESKVGEFKQLPYDVSILDTDLCFRDGDEAPPSSLPDTVFTNLPPSTPVECIVRVYVIKGLHLQPQDVNGMVDSYITISIGKKTIDDEDNYIPNDVNPEYGRVYELAAKIPLAKDLKITVKDRDVMGKDDIIGETVIDLEQRLLSRYRATCGLPNDYYRSGIYQWRDSRKPKKLLQDWCTLNNKPSPSYGVDNLLVDSKTYSIDDIKEEEGALSKAHLGSDDQRLALHALNQLELLPEHVETRALYSSLQPSIEQGKLQMWVDIFPKLLGKPPPPVDISSRIPKPYVLRVVVWNTADVFLEETSITGEKMSDIFVKGWLDGLDDSQETDVHYRSLNGEGNFNWRLVYPFMYLPHDRKLVKTEKEYLWSVSETMIKLTPKLVIQIWDNDIIGSDDFIGSVELDLTHLLDPAPTSGRCKLPTIIKQSADDQIDLFSKRIVRGWWPVSSNKSGKEILKGKLEMTIEVLTEAEAKERPAGEGHEDPNKNPPLPEPQRPATSFLWFTSPFKTLKFIIWKRYKWVILGILLLIILILIVGLFIYSTPVRMIYLGFTNVQ